jgi:hypothetical protein
MAMNFASRHLSGPFASVFQLRATGQIVVIRVGFLSGARVRQSMASRSWTRGQMWILHPLHRRLLVRQ